MQMEISVVKKNLLLLFLMMPSWRKNGQVRKEEPLFFVETHVFITGTTTQRIFRCRQKSIFKGDFRTYGTNYKWGIYRNGTAIVVLIYFLVPGQIVHKNKTPLASYCFMLSMWESITGLLDQCWSYKAVHNFTSSFMLLLLTTSSSLIRNGIEVEQ
jgi:hypothetical protein